MADKPRGRVKNTTRYTLRHYDAYDRYWFDVKADISYDEAYGLWDKETKGGTVFSRYSHGAYFDIYPSNTRMIFDGEGN